MTLNASGPLSIGGSTVGQSINLELGLSATAQSSLNDSALRALAGVASGQISINNFYGKSSNIFFGLAISSGGSSCSPIGVSSNGSVCYATDKIDILNTSELTVVRPNGTIAWSRRLSATSSVVILNSAVFDASGNVYCSGYSGPASNTRTMFLAKFDSSGGLIFSKQTTLAAAPNLSLCMAIDVTGSEIHLAGQYGESTSMAAFVTGWSASNGTLVRNSIDFNNTSVAGLDSYFGISSNQQSGSLERYYAVGSTAANSRGLFVKMTFAHTVEWAYLITESPTQVYGQAVGVYAHNANEIYVVGYVNNYYYLIKFDSNGTKLWARQMASSVFAFSAVTTDSLGNVYVVGRFQYSGFNNKIIVCKYTSDGTILYHYTITAGTNSIGKAIKVVDNVMYIYGSTSALAPQNTGSLIFRLPSDASLVGTFGNYVLETIGAANPTSEITTVSLSYSTQGYTLSTESVGTSQVLNPTSNLQIMS